MNNCFAEFLQKSGLYDSIAITEENFTDLCALIGGKVKISEYCKECREQRVFYMLPITFNYGHLDINNPVRFLSDELINLQNSRKLAATPRPGEKREKLDWVWTNALTEKATRIMVFSFMCTMDENHYLDYIVQTNENTMIKIGQYPSVADISYPELNEFKIDIDELTRKELGRAIGLYAHGIGVGSYVYLRRIFERILDKAKQLAENEGKIDVSNYHSLSNTEKINLLHKYLPEFINSSNKVFYGIISKGIHELSEEECNHYFPVLKEAIYMILRQWAQMRKQRESENRIYSSLNSIASKISQDKN